MKKVKATENNYTMLSGAINRTKILTVIGLIVALLGVLMPRTDLFSPTAITVMGVAYLVFTTVKDYFDPKVRNN